MYKVDKSRVNEFGFSGEMEEESKKKVAVPAVTEQSSSIQNNAVTPTQEPVKPKKDKKKD